MSGLQYITNMCSKDAFQQSLFCFRQFRLCLACSYQIPVLDNKLIITSFVGTKKEIFHIMNFFKSIAVLFTKCKGMWHLQVFSFQKFFSGFFLSRPFFCVSDDRFYPTDHVIDVMKKGPALIYF